MKRGSNGRFQINVVDGDEGIEEWLPVNTLTPGEVLDEDGDVALDTELAQGINPAEACAVELTLLEQTQK